MGNIKEINIKNLTYYFLNNMINIRQTKIDKKSNENIVTYSIGYITIKKIDNYENINSVNPLYLMIGDVSGHFEENNGNKHLVFDSSE